MFSAYPMKTKQKRNTAYKPTKSDFTKEELLWQRIFVRTNVMSLLGFFDWHTEHTLFYVFFFSFCIWFLFHLYFFVNIRFLLQTALLLDLFFSVDFFVLSYNLIRLYFISIHQLHIIQEFDNVWYGWMNAVYEIYTTPMYDLFCCVCFYSFFYYSFLSSLVFQQNKKTKWSCWNFDFESNKCTNSIRIFFSFFVLLIFFHHL